MEFRVFNPVASTKLAVTSTTGNVALPGSFGNAQIRRVRLVNEGDGEVWVKFGDNAVTAVNDGTDMYLGATKSAEIFQPQQSATHIAAISSSGETATLFITTGEGI